MNANQKFAIDRIKDKNGGALPSELYLKKNEELSKMVFDLTGKMPSARASKETLVAQIEKATNGATPAKATTKSTPAKSAPAKSTPAKADTSAKKRKLENDDDAPIVGAKGAAKQPAAKKATAKPAEDEAKKIPRGCLAELTPAQKAEMKLVLSQTVEAMASKYTHKELQPIWERLGVTSKYPMMSPKTTIVTKMQEFATRNLAYH